jgi:hypothetical protein
MSAPFRIIVTGSRDWTDGAAVERALLEAVLVAQATGNGGTVPTVIVQGGAAGADALAVAWAKDYAGRDVTVETFAADWDKHGKAAGPIRNTQMAAAGAGMVLAFPIGDRHHSPGTWHCIEACASRGIPVRIFGRPAHG